jgi:hypothetical protein
MERAWGSRRGQRTIVVFLIVLDGHDTYNKMAKSARWQ